MRPKKRSTSSSWVADEPAPASSISTTEPAGIERTTNRVKAATWGSDVADTGGRASTPMSMATPARLARPTTTGRPARRTCAERSPAGTSRRSTESTDATGSTHAQMTRYPNAKPTMWLAPSTRPPRPTTDAAPRPATKRRRALSPRTRLEIPATSDPSAVTTASRWWCGGPPRIEDMISAGPTVATANPATAVWRLSVNDKVACGVVKNRQSSVMLPG